MGARSAYKPEYAEQARKLCLLLGATDVEIANFFETTDRTIRTWKRKHPEFAAALERGKVSSDMDVAEALYKKALGGDTIACIFWLKNRHRTVWRDRHDHEIAGPNGGPIEHKQAIDVSGLTDEQLRVLSGLRIEK